tara:strand:- start:2701 stop:3189 length:489 start_codon:yes stop_codon:yes gene_type:complete
VVFEIERAWRPQDDGLDPGKMFCDWSPLPDKVFFYNEQGTHFRIAIPPEMPVDYSPPTEPIKPLTIETETAELKLFCLALGNPANPFFECAHIYQRYGWEPRTRSVVVGCHPTIDTFFWANHLLAQRYWAAEDEGDRRTMERCRSNVRQAQQGAYEIFEEPP